MVTVMENGGGGSFGDWDYEQFDEAVVGDENLSIDVDEFLGLLDEDPDPAKVACFFNRLFLGHFDDRDVWID